jgi:hypothetical protein
LKLSLVHRKNKEKIKLAIDSSFLLLSRAKEYNFYKFAFATKLRKKAKKKKVFLSKKGQAMTNQESKKFFHCLSVKKYLKFFLFML